MLFGTLATDQHPPSAKCTFLANAHQAIAKSLILNDFWAKRAE
jgi:hypothetical protein